MNSVDTYGPKQEALLKSYYDDEKIGKYLKPYFQIHGILFGMACSPVPIQPVDWIELIVEGEDGFVSNEKATEMLEVFASLFTHYQKMAIAKDVSLPAETLFDPSDLSPEQPLSQWCTGFLTAHFALKEHWQKAIGIINQNSDIENVENELESLLAISAALSDIPAAIESGQSDEVTEEKIPNLVEILPRALGTYGQLGVTSASLLASKPQTVKRDAPKVGRNDPCPCGSGKKYKKCCINANA